MAHRTFFNCDPQEAVFAYSFLAVLADKMHAASILSVLVTEVQFD
jgi:hypothetical protein